MNPYHIAGPYLVVGTYHIVLNKPHGLNKHAPYTFWWIIPLKIRKLVKKEQRWLTNVYNGPLAPRIHWVSVNVQRAFIWHYTVELLEGHVNFLGACEFKIHMPNRACEFFWCLLALLDHRALGTQKYAKLMIFLYSKMHGFEVRFWAHLNSFQ